MNRQDQKCLNARCQKKPKPKRLVPLRFLSYSFSYYQNKFFSVNLPASVQQGLAKFLVDELGTNDIFAAQSYLEEPLRKLLHQMLSRPEYQLG